MPQPPLLGEEGKKSRPLICCFLLVAVCYANSLPNGFIQDDHLIITNNESIRSIAPLRFLGESYWPKTMTGGTYRPLTIFTFSIEYALWGAWPPGFRITNLVFHALNGWLVFLLVNSLAGALPAWGAAAIYVAHPVHTEAVVGIVGRSELLAGGLFFLAWLAFRSGRIAAAMVLFFMSLLGKENAIMFPAVAALDVVVFRGGFSKLRAHWHHLAALVAVALSYLALRFSVLGELGVPVANQYLGGAPLLQRWLTSGRVFLRYVQLVIAPVDVAGSYEFNSIPMATATSWDAWLGLAFAAILLTFAVVRARRRPAFSFSILFFFVALIPVSNWIMPLTILMAERLLYTPVFGASLLAGILWAGLQSRRAQQLIGAGTLAAAATLCISHNYAWADDFTFYKNMVRVVPNNVSGRSGYGFELQARGRIDEARQQFEAGLGIDPGNPVLLAHMAALKAQTEPAGCAEARPLVERALRRRPNHWQSYWVLANCYLMEGDRAKADEFYRLAIEHAPVPDASLLYMRGRNLETMGKHADARDLYQRAATLNPSDTEIRRRLEALSK